MQDNDIVYTYNIYYCGNLLVFSVLDIKIVCG